MNASRCFAVFLGIILISSTFASQSFADVISPRQQMKLDLTAEQVICSEGLVKVFKKSTGDATCVKPATAEKLAQNGWANQLSEQKIDEIAMTKIKKGESVGTIKKIATVKQTSTTPKAGVSGYAYIFEACAISKTVRAPEVYITSDSETRSVKLGSMLKPASCYTSSIIIKAADPNSISATLLNQGGISETISTLESQIATLKDDIATAKQNLPKFGDERKPNPDNINNITSMKNELKNLQDQLRRYLMVLYAPPTKISVINAPKSLTGTPLEGMSTNIVSLTESVVKPESSTGDLKRFNVVFEACAGKQAVRLPIIDMASDSDSVTVKLIDRIIPESCQVGVARINATDSESIELKISGNSSASIVVFNLEEEIKQLESDLADKRSSLGLLVSKQLDAEGEKVAEQLASDISKLRTDLLETRAKLYNLMLGL